MKYQLIACTLILNMVACSPSKKTAEEAHLGDLQHEFAISGNARASFDEGLLLLHSFEYEDARDAFQKASEAAPEELMAYWGETMTHYKALWRLQNLEDGREVMQKLGNSKEERLAKAGDELEKDFWNGVEILFGEGEMDERNQAFADHMGELYEKYPGNQEVAAFYALGLMWTVRGRDTEVYGKSANIAAGILEENPSHPGAIHYMIHAYDDPDYAELAIDAANVYAKTAPDAAHALHMPSHIYLALGMWNDVVASNEVSYAASVKRMERKGLTDDARGYHSYAWLHYGYLQQGRYEDAKRLLDDMMVYTDRSPSTGARGYLIYMQNLQKIESGKWEQEKEPMFVKDDDLGLYAQISQHFMKSLMAFDDGNAPAIRELIDEAIINYDVAKLEVDNGSIARCSAGTTRYAPTNRTLNWASILMNQMEAMAAMVDGDTNKAEEFLKKAVALERDSEYSFGPPDVPYPSFEQYAQLLIAQERYDEALAQYDISLKRAPKRALALQGKMEVLKKLGRNDEALAVQKELDVFWIGEMMASAD